MATVSERSKTKQITKHTDTSRGTDSGVNGNAQTSAREIRASEWLTARDIPLEWPYYTNKQYHTLKLAEALSRYAESECSRLASRVEELENLIAKHSECSHGIDSASGSESARIAKETR